MLRISVHDENRSTGFAIEGKLTAPGAMELEKVWQAAIAARPLRPIVVSLVRVTFIDLEGKELLIRMRRQGVRLVPTGCLMTATVEQIEAEVANENMSSQTST